MLPAKRRNVLKQGRVHRGVLCQMNGGYFDIDRVPERECCDNQVQPAGALALVLEGAIGGFESCRWRRAA